MPVIDEVVIAESPRSAEATEATVLTMLDVVVDVVVDDDDDESADDTLLAASDSEKADAVPHNINAVESVMKIFFIVFVLVC